MKLAGLGRLYAILYDDTIVVYRTVQGLNEDGTVSSSYAREFICKVAGRVSFDSDDKAADSEVDRNPVAFNPKLFCAPDVDLKAGDYVEVLREADNGEWEITYKGVIAMPSKYSTHQEAFFRVDEGA